MSNSLAVAAVTAAFGRVITQALQGVPNLSAAPELRIGRPPMDPAFVGANLFLFRVSPSPARRNDDIATRTADGVLVRRPQAALDLEYVVSFYGNEVGLEPHRLMGSVVALLHARPILTSRDIQAVIAGSGPQGILAGSDLDQQAEPIRFTLQPLDIENLHRIWSLFYTVPYALSVVYTGSTILLDADLAPSRAPPARLAVVSARAELPPTIQSLSPPVVVFGAGANLTVHGDSLLTGTARLRFGAIDVDAVRQAGGLGATLPTGLRAGINPVRVVIGGPEEPLPALESAEALFVLAPRVADGAVYRSIPDPRTGAPIDTITVRLAPTPGFAQPVQLFLNPLPSANAQPMARAPSGSLVPLRFSLDAQLAVDLDSGAVTQAVRDAFAAQRLHLDPDVAVVVEQKGMLWRLREAKTNLACRLERDGAQIVVHYALAYDDGTLAFQIPTLAPGNYLVSVQIGPEAAATSPLRWGALLFRVPAPTDGLDDGHLSPALAGAFAANGIALSDRLAIARPIPGDGWAIDDEGKRCRYWIAMDAGTLTVYQLDAAGSTFFGPVIALPGPRSGA